MAGGIPALTGIVPLPSPAAGDQPSGGDLFSNLLSAAPNFTQGMEAAQQMKAQREELKAKQMQLATQRLQTFTPIALQDPSNPAAIKAIQQSFKEAGLDPKLALGKDGKINTEALAQYSPWFQLLASPGAPFLPKDVLQFYAQKAGVQLPPSFGGATNPKDLPSLMTAIRSAASSGDMRMLASLGQELTTIPGQEALGQSIVAEAQSGHLSPKLSATLAHLNAGTNLDKAETVYTQGPKTAVANSTVAVNNARVPEIQSQTAVNQNRTQLIQQQIHESQARITHMAHEDKHLDAETQHAYQAIHAGGSVLSTFRAIAVPYNHALTMVATAQKAVDTAQANLNNPLAATDPNLKAMYQQEYAAAKQRLGKANAVLQQIKPAYDTYFKAVTNGAGVPGQQPGGKRFGNAMLHEYMQKAHLPEAAALKQALSEGWVFDPTMP